MNELKNWSQVSLNFRIIMNLNKN